MRTNYVYSTPGNTQKSFSWARLNSNVISNMWFQLSWKRLGTYALLALLLFIYLVATPGAMTLLVLNFMNPLVYAFWRLADLVYFFLLQLQYLFMVSAIALLFTSVNFAASTDFNIMSWMRSYHAETPVNFATTTKPSQTSEINVSTQMGALFLHEFESFGIKPTTTTSNLDQELILLKKYFILKSFESFTLLKGNLSFLNTTAATSIGFETLSPLHSAPHKPYTNSSFLPSTILSENKSLSFLLFGTSPLSPANPNQDLSLIALDCNLSFTQTVTSFFKLTRWASGYNLTHKPSLNLLEQVSALSSSASATSPSEWVTFRSSLGLQNNSGSRIPALLPVSDLSFKNVSNLNTKTGYLVEFFTMTDDFSGLINSTLSTQQPSVFGKSGWSVFTFESGAALRYTTAFNIVKSANNFQFEESVFVLPDTFSNDFDRTVDGFFL